MSGDGMQFQNKGCSLWGSTPQISLWICEGWMNYSLCKKIHSVTTSIPQEIPKNEKNKKEGGQNMDEDEYNDDDYESEIDDDEDEDF